MATPVKRGNDNPILQRQEYSYDWTRGGTYGEVWRGINPDKMLAKWQGSVYTAQSARMTISQDVAELQLQWSGTSGGSGGGSGGSDPGTIQVTLDRWEIAEPATMRNIFAHPQFLAIWSATGLDEKQLSNVVSTIQSAAEAQRAASQSQADEDRLKVTLTAYYAKLGLSMPSSVPYEKAMRFFRLYVNDQAHYQSASYSVRHTTTAPNYWGLNRADQYVNCIYSPAQFASEVTDSGLWYLPLPGRLQFKLAAAVSALIAVTPTRSNFLTGWRKSPSSEATVAKGRIEIQTRYDLDQWSTDLYPTVS